MEKVVTRDVLRGMSLGESRTFELPDALAIDAAGTTAYQLQHIEGCRYTCSKNYAERQITITKSAL